MTYLSWALMFPPRDFMESSKVKQLIIADIDWAILRYDQQEEPGGENETSVDPLFPEIMACRWVERGRMMSLLWACSVEDSAHRETRAWLLRRVPVMSLPHAERPTHDCYLYCPTRTPPMKGQGVSNRVCSATTTRLWRLRTSRDQGPIQPSRATSFLSRIFYPHTCLGL